LFLKGQEIIQKLWEGIKSIWDSIIKWFQEKLNIFADMPKTIVAKIKQAGSNVIDGFLSGIQNAWTTLTGWLDDALSSLANKFEQAKNWVKGIFDKKA